MILLTPSSDEESLAIDWLWNHVKFRLQNAIKDGDYAALSIVPFLSRVYCFFQSTSKLFLSERASWVQLKEFARKNAANALSLANMVMGMASILSSLNGHHYAACWLVLIGYLLDLADGAVARQLNACSTLGAKLDDFADFTTFGIATSLLLRTSNILDNVLCMCYMLSVFIRLCFFSSGIPFMYRGLPCIYSSASLACLSLLTGGNMTVLRLTAIAMIVFMGSQTLYPHDRVLESQAWKKVVYAGGNISREHTHVHPAGEHTGVNWTNCAVFTFLSLAPVLPYCTIRTNLSFKTAQFDSIIDSRWHIM
ncbi:transmembrane protein 269 isoform X2 [Tachysurus fulvidraco]|uniref:transmembrane protein 269 isoform X2 n=1 Tax=Tachysurus fulvidraco TaxID=1234273 RepID=UPI000F51235F|nr:transmembrane protein 269 isoform X2 [Tachysurus fulvidraco]